MKTGIGLTNHIMFTFSVKSEHELRYFKLPAWDHWKATLLPAMEAVTAPYGYARGYYPRVMLARLPAGKFVGPHKDGKDWAVHPHKIHIPIQTNDQSFFFLEKERFHFEVGKGYEVNNGLQHRVVNGGTTDRIHLIFEYMNWEEQEELVQQKMDTANYQYE